MLFLPSLVLTLQPDSDVFACTMNNEVIRSRNVETGYNSVLTTKVRYQTRLNLLIKKLKKNIILKCWLVRTDFVCLFFVCIFCIFIVNSFQLLIVLS